MGNERVGGNGRYVLTQEGLLDHEEGLLNLDWDSIPRWIHGERRLLCELLSQGVRELNYGDANVRMEAEEWLLDPDATQEDAFSLPWICMHLDLDLEDVRRRVRGLRRGVRSDVLLDGESQRQALDSSPQV